MSIITDFPLVDTIGTSLRPQRYDIEMYQGDTFEVEFTFNQAGGAPVNLTGVTYASKFVGVDGAPDPVTQPVITCPTPTNGKVTFSIIDSSSLSGTYNWDLQLIIDGRKRTYIGGIVNVTTDITP